MLICIECCYLVKIFWCEGGMSNIFFIINKFFVLGGYNIWFIVCKNCGWFCDKYVEYDFVVLFIDLVFIKL